MNSPVQRVTHGNRVVLRVAGEVDIVTTATLRAELAELIAQHHTDLVIDLTNVTFIDSTGLGVLVGALRSVSAEGGRVELVTANPQVLKALRLTALSRIFTIHPDVTTALADPATAVVPAAVAAGGSAEHRDPLWDALTSG